MKKNDIKGLSKEDLLLKIKEESAQLAKLKFAHEVSPIENPLQIRHAKRSIARLKTELNSK
jgi:large subunit ribosomal protein L29